MSEVLMFGVVEMTAERWANMEPHLRTEAALLARERGTLVGSARLAKALCASPKDVVDVLEQRHQHRLPGERDLTGYDEAAREREARSAAEGLHLSRASGKLLAWLVQVPDGRMALSISEMEDAAGIGRGAGDYALRRLYGWDYVAPAHGKSGPRTRIWQVTKAGYDAAASAGLVAETGQ